jgi:hypothetical protein
MSYGRTVEHNNSNRNDYNDKRKYDDINRGDDNRRRSFNGGGDDRRNSFNGGRGNRQPFVARKTGLKSGLDIHHVIEIDDFDAISNLSLVP